MPCEHHFHPALAQHLRHVVAACHDIVRQQLRLAVDVLHQVVVHHGNHALAASPGHRKLLPYPLQRLGPHSTIGVVGHIAVGTT